MKPIAVILTLTAFLVALSTACGAPAIGELKSITLSASPSTNLEAIGDTVQLSSMGVYSTGEKRDITAKVKYSIAATGTDDLGNPLPAPPATAALNSTGLITAVMPFLCTWVDTTPGQLTPTWAVSGSYQVIASYNEVNSQPVFVTVASALSNTNPKRGNCGP